MIEKASAESRCKHLILHSIRYNRRLFKRSHCVPKVGSNLVLNAQRSCWREKSIMLSTLWSERFLFLFSLLSSVCWWVVIWDNRASVLINVLRIEMSNSRIRNPWTYSFDTEFKHWEYFTDVEYPVCMYWYEALICIEQLGPPVKPSGSES